MLFIAEIGLNHNGDFDLACEMIEKAKRAGADIAKFQLGWRSQEGEINHITDEILQRLIKCCEIAGIEFMASIFTEEAYSMIRKYGVRRYKIASRTVKDDPALVDKIASEGKETIISLGMWHDKERRPIEKRPNVKYLWCRSKYPAEPLDLTDLPKDFRRMELDGYSDHSIGIEVPLIAVVRGASIIEKHFTLDKSDKTIRDHALSATPDEFRTMVELGRAIDRDLRAGV